MTSVVPWAGVVWIVQRIAGRRASRGRRPCDARSMGRASRPVARPPTAEPPRWCVARWSPAR